LGCGQCGKQGFGLKKVKGKTAGHFVCNIMGWGLEKKGGHRNTQEWWSDGRGNGEKVGVSRQPYSVLKQKALGGGVLV